MLLAETSASADWCEPGDARLRQTVMVYLRRWLAATCVAAVTVISGCGGTPAAQTGASPAPSASVRSDPLLLVGQWFLEADGEQPGSAIFLREEMTLFRGCGVMDGQWKADGAQSLFVASSASGDGGCFKGNGPPSIPWLEAAVAFRIDGSNRRLLDSAGHTVAVLRPGAKPTVGPNRSKDFYERPTRVTPSMRADVQEPRALPTDVMPARLEDLARRWRPVEVNPSSEAHLAFQEVGRWLGSDGCNGQGGRYVLGRGGRLLSTGGPSTLIGCDGAPVGAWMGRAALAGISNEHLVLYDRSGELVGKLTAAEG